jgi:Hg(II)-responsive transcriptional regulator
MRLSIGKLAATAGVNVETVRYYERRGLLAAPPRTAGGYRQYAPETVERLRFIKGAQELGFTLDEIQELLELRAHDPAACATVETRTRQKIAQIHAKIRELGRLKRALERLAHACEQRRPMAECPVLEMLTEASHAASSEASHGVRGVGLYPDAGVHVEHAQDA